MDAQSSAPSARRWLPIDQLLSAIENDRVIDLPARTAPVYPASDEECFALHPPEECFSSIRNAGLRQASGLNRGGRKPASS